MNSTTLTNMFVLTVPWLEKILRPIIVYLALIIGLRLAVKRELAQLNPFDLVVLLTISNTVQNAIIGSDNSVLGGVIGATTLLVFNYLVVRFVFAHPWAERYLEGDADILIRNGKLLNERLRAEGVTLGELEAKARSQGFASINEVDKAILEANGSVTFVAKKPRPHEARHQDLMKGTQELWNLLHSFDARVELRFEPICAAGGEVIQIRDCCRRDYPSAEIS